jgi:Endodeoxyribonuclease RusA
MVDERFSDEQRPVNLEFEIDLEPMAWKHPKPFVKKAVGNGKKFYTKNVANVNKQNTQRFQDLVSQQYKAKYGPLAGPHFVDNVVVVDMCFARKLPNKMFVNSNRDRPLKPKYMVAFQQGRVADKSTPDVDNLSKFVLDALQNIIYCNDSQVVKCGGIGLIVYFSIIPFSPLG